MHDITRRSFAFTVLGALAARGQASEELSALTLAGASAGIRSRAVTPTQLTEACLARIQTYNPKLNAFITVLRERAMTEARDLEAEQRAGKLRGPLHGIPIALKDNVDTAGIRTTAASAVFDDRVPTEDAEVARRLKAAGAILIGKTNCMNSRWAGHRLPATTVRCATRGRSIAILVDRRVARPPPSQPISATGRWVPIPAVPSARPLRFAGSSD